METLTQEMQGDRILSDLNNFDSIQPWVFRIPTGLRSDFIGIRLMGLLLLGIFFSLSLLFYIQTFSIIVYSIEKTFFYTLVHFKSEKILIEPWKTFGFLWNLYGFEFPRFYQCFSFFRYISVHQYNIIFLTGKISVSNDRVRQHEQSAWKLCFSKA